PRSTPARCHIRAKCRAARGGADLLALLPPLAQHPRWVSLSCQLHCRNQDFRDLRPRELRGWDLAAPQHVSHRRTRKRNASAGLMGTSLGGGHALALLAVKGMLEHERHDSDLVAPKLSEDLLRVVSAVIVADSSMIAPHDKMRAPIVLAH